MLIGSSLMIISVKCSISLKSLLKKLCSWLFCVLFMLFRVVLR